MHQLYSTIRLFTNTLTFNLFDQLIKLQSAKHGSTHQQVSYV